MLIDSVIVTDIVNVYVKNTMKVYIKLFTIIASAILLSTVGLVCSNEIAPRTSVGSIRHPTLLKKVKMRCTRRYSPGVCVESVTPVWTFEFFQQNCTERLGCPNHYRTNRFRSYKMCMKRCRPLMEMYLHMLEFVEKVEDTNATLDDTNVTLDSGKGHKTDDPNLREGLSKFLPTSKFPKSLPELEDQDDEEEEYKASEEDTRFVIYKDVNEDIMPADVDYVPVEIRSEVMQW